MVLVSFLAEFTDGVVLSVPVALAPTSVRASGPAPAAAAASSGPKLTVAHFLRRFREKCGIPSDTAIDVRATDGAPLRGPAREVEIEGSCALMVIVECAAPAKALSLRDELLRNVHARVGGSSAQHQAEGKIVGTAASSGSSTSPLRFVGGGPATTLDGHDADHHVDSDNNSSSSSSDDNDAAAAAEAAAEVAAESNAKGAAAARHGHRVAGSSGGPNCGPRQYEAAGALHFISHGEGVEPTAITRVSTSFNERLCVERPVAVPLHSVALVDAMRRSDTMRRWGTLLDEVAVAAELTALRMASKTNDDHASTDPAVPAAAVPIASPVAGSIAGETAEDDDHSGIAAAAAQTFAAGSIQDAINLAKAHVTAGAAKGKKRPPAAAGAASPTRDASPIAGMPEREFARLLAAAKRFGHISPTTAAPGGEAEEPTVLFYPVLDAVAHACNPSAVMRIARAAPHLASIRSVRLAPTGDATERDGGLERGDRVSALRPRCNYIDFLLLPTERRRAILKRQYALRMDCICERCTGRVGVAAGDFEESLNGAFFKPTVASADESVAAASHLTARQRAALAAQMRADFAQLGLFVMPEDRRASAAVAAFRRGRRNGKGAAAATAATPAVARAVDPNFSEDAASLLSKAVRAGGVIEPTQRAVIAAFLRKYGPNGGANYPASTILPEVEAGKDATFSASDSLPTDVRVELHRNHWRLTMCRLALLAPHDPFLPPLPAAALAAGQRRPLVDKFIVQVVLEQLQVEAALSHAYGFVHPAQHRTFLIFRSIIASMPEQLSAVTQRAALRLSPEVQWQRLEVAAAPELKRLRELRAEKAVSS